MELRLEPMTVGQILDNAFRLYSRNFLRFITIVAVVQVPIFLVQLVIGKATVDAAIDMRLEKGGAGGMYALVGISILVGIFAQALCNGALVKGISGAYLNQPVSVGIAYRQVLPKILSLVGASIMVAVVVMLGFVFLIVPGIILLTMYALTTQAMVCEDLGAFKGMTRSEKLSKGNKGKIFWVLLVVGLLTVVVGWVFGFVADSLQKQTTNLEELRSVVWFNVLVQSLFNLVSSTLIAPITAGATILLYYDLRIRKEGFDLEMMARSMNLAAPALAAPSTPPGPTTPV